MKDEQPLNPLLTDAIIAEETVKSWRKRQGKKLNVVFANNPKPFPTGAVPKRNFKSPIKVVRNEDS